MDDIEHEKRAVLARAAHVEAERQAAQERRDWPRLAATERELHALWQRHGELERASAA